MIGRVHGTGISFKKLCSYLATGEDGLQLERDRVLGVEFFKLPTRNWEVAACMMAATASTSVSNTQEPLYHFSISCHPDDPVDSETLRGIARRTIRDMGLRDYQVVVFAHKDRSHPHLHFVVNRVHPERCTLWSMWRDFYRMERSLRAQEVELGLQVVPGWLVPTLAAEGLGLGIEGQEHEGAAGWLRPRPGPRRGDDDFLRHVTERATPVLERALSWAELERGLADHRLTVRVNRGGLQFTDGRFQVKASAVGRAYSRKNLEKRFGRYPDYRARMAVASQAITPPARAVHPAATAREQEPPAPPLAAPAPEAVERGPASEPSPERSSAGFLAEVKERAGPVLRRATSWAELERGLSERGLSLRMSGGGFTVTDGRQEVKASDVGRVFSRYHLEKRLGRYPASVSIIEPDAPALPADAPTLPQAPWADLALEVSPVTDAAPQPNIPPPSSPQTTSGIETTATDRSGADGPAQLDLLFGPGVPQMDDGRGRASVPADDLGQAAGPAQLDLPLASDAPRLPTAPALDQARAPVRRTEAPSPLDPVRTTPPGLLPAPPQPSRPVEQTRAPERPRRPDRPPTERERYREARRSFGRALARLYSHPDAARRAFAMEAYLSGTEYAVERLRLEPDRYWALRSDSRVEDAAAAARMGFLYAQVHHERTRAGLLPASIVLRIAADAELADEQIRLKRTEADDAQRAYDTLRSLEHKIGRADQLLLETAGKVYRYPEPALATLKERHELLAIVGWGHALQKELRDHPERFGRLLSRGWGLKEVVGLGDFRQARSYASLLARHLEYRMGLGQPPSQAQVLDAATHASGAWAALESAEHTRRMVSAETVSSLVRSVAPDLRRALRKVGRTRLEQQLKAMLPSHALKVSLDAIQTAIELAEGPGQQNRGWEI